MLKISQIFFKKIMVKENKASFFKSFGNIPLVGMESSKWKLIKKDVMNPLLNYYGTKLWKLFMSSKNILIHEFNIR